ncbi:hypothetical protein MHB77_17075 [Paenibacillus sp. FSL K6-3166]|uniref:hypothetical protein n=1 Tax=unclassified Paenibacillus TaxID=185978 RepID=UPI000BA16A92|nr:hypothetical protein [Paenibacillus sp. VTT E-133291]OZQ91141.1 hypothetical protein CA598_12280 [Paenibacillus sp. VTT E-133291]
MTGIFSQLVDVDDNVAGHLWTVDEIHELAKTIALIALGQAEHAAEIISQIGLTVPVHTISEFYQEAREQLRIRGNTPKEIEVSHYHRDGFLFECISWIVACQVADENTYLKDPHISSTTQGLDGLIIQMDPVEKIVLHTTICEDKCTQNPRDTFRNKVMIAFKEHHQNKRGRDLLANAITLIKQSGLTGTAATLAAARVHDKTYRSYRAALTVNSDISTAEERQKLFKGYEGLTDISQLQRIGATFIVIGDLREWFQELADRVINSLDEFEAGECSDV